jgi:MFS family permease
MAVLAYFVILGLAEGIWIARIPALKARLNLADSLLGASLLAGPAGLVLVMPLAGRLADRFGSARLIWPAGLAVAVLPLALWSARTLPEVTGAVLAFGIAGGVLLVGLNAQGVRLERGCGRPLMGSFYASFSLGGLAVAGFAACGGGLSCTMPQLFSAAGRADPVHPGGAVARVGALGYLGLVGGPVLIGGSASLAGLTIALYIPVLLALCVTGFAFVLDRPVVSGPVASGPVVSEPVLSGTGPGRSAGSRSR